MKILKFNTSHGDFALMDGPEQIDQTLKASLDEYTPVAKVSEMTEEQFGEVIHYSQEFVGYIDYGGHTEYSTVETAKDSFTSLIRALGWHLWENPHGKECQALRAGYYSEWRQAESKTLYSPILLKKI